MDYREDVYLFMDDHAIFFKDWESLKYHQPRMEEMWTNHGLMVEPKKTKIMKLDPSKDEPPDPPYEFVKEYKYLGTEVFFLENWEKTVKKYVREYSEKRRRWKGWYLYGDLEVEKIAFRSYYFSKIAH